MRKSLTTLMLALCAIFAGCTFTQPAYNAAQHTGAIGEGTVSQLNALANLSIQLNALRGFMLGDGRSISDMSQGLGRIDVMQDAIQNAERRFQGELNALSAGDQVSAGRRTAEEVNAQTVRLLSSLGSQMTDIRAEIDQLKAASGPSTPR